MSKILCSIALLLAAQFLSAQSLRFYKVDQLGEYEQVLEKAREEQRMLVAVVYRPDGIFADMVRSGVLRNDSLTELYQKGLPMASEMEGNMGGRLMESFGAAELPVFYFITHEELLVHRTQGRQSSQDLIKAWHQAVQNETKFNTLKQKYASNELSTSDWLELIPLYEMNFDFESTRKRVHEFLATQPEKAWWSDSIRPLVLAYGLDLEGRFAPAVIKRKENIDSTEYRLFFEAAYSYNFDRAAFNNDTLLLQKIIEKLIPTSPEHDSIKEQLRFDTRKQFALETDNFSPWVQAIMEQSRKQENDSLKANYIFEVAFGIAEDYNSTEAQATVAHMARTAYDLHPNFRYKMLEAYMLYLQEKYDIALDQAKTAQKRATNSADQKKVESLIKLITDKKQ